MPADRDAASMATMSVRVTGKPSAASKGRAGGGDITFDLPVAEGGRGAGFNGGEALLLAVAGCYANDLHRRAKEAGIPLRGFCIDAQGDWGGDPVVCKRIRCLVDIDAQCDDAARDALREALDGQAAIPLTLRRGVPVDVELVETA